MYENTSYKRWCQLEQLGFVKIKNISEPRKCPYRSLTKVIRVEFTF